MLPVALIQRAGAVVRQGGIIAYPTEGVFGLGCAPGDPEAVARICAMKQRPLSAGLILIAAEVSQLCGYIAPDAAERARMRATAGRPVSWVVRAGPLAGNWLTGGRTRVAVRITAHPTAAALCRAAGMPLVSTSANRRGRRPARLALQVRRWFGHQVDLVLPGPVGDAAGPSEIRDAASGALLRPGASM